MSTVYRRHADLRLTSLGSEGVVLHLGTLRYFTVNDTGKTILAALESPQSFPDLVGAITRDFEVSTAVAEETTRSFLTACVDAGLVVGADE